MKIFSREWKVIKTKEVGENKEKFKNKIEAITAAS